jgi:hypothetical protein
MTPVMKPMSDPLGEWIEWIFDVMAERDADFEFQRFPPSVLNFSANDQSGVHLVFMQVSKQNAKLNEAFRHAAKTLLMDEDLKLQMPAKAFISDLIDMPPVTNENRKSTLFRDILIIWAIAILREMGFRPTKNETTMSDEASACEAVFAVLQNRNMKFANQVETINKIWSKRRARFLKIGLEHLAP